MKLCRPTGDGASEVACRTATKGMEEKKIASLGALSRPRIILALPVLLLAVGVALPVSALDKTVSLGKDQLWRNMGKMESVVLQPGNGGFPVLALRTDEYVPNSTTDLLIHFDGGTPQDATGNYNTVTSSITTSRRWARLGAAAGVFQGERNALVLAPASTRALFAPGNDWRDFSIEFWMYPATLSDGEKIFQWEGASKAGGTLTPQSVVCEIENGRLTWTFTNFFRPPSLASFTVSLRDAGALIPREWHHYTLRFNAGTGMIESLVDGKPESITYANNAGAENGKVFEPQIGNAAESRIVIGSGFTGFLDELRVSSTFVHSPNNYRYALSPGTAITRPIDLGYTDSVVTSISASETTPGTTGVFYYYRTANQKSGNEDLSGKWVQFAPNAPLPSTPSGKFIQFKIELLPGGSGDHTPTVSELAFTYQPRLPPPAPAYLTATPGNGQIALSWRKVVDSHLKGYEIFYGDRPEQYFGTDSSSGASPIDVGNVTSFDVKGLTNGKLYYFAVIAYDTSTPPHLSAFSNQVAARPSTIAGGG